MNLLVIARAITGAVNFPLLRTNKRSVKCVLSLSVFWTEKGRALKAICAPRQGRGSFALRKNDRYSAKKILILLVAAISYSH